MSRLPLGRRLFLFKEMHHQSQDVLASCPELKGGSYGTNDKPGLGIRPGRKTGGQVPDQRRSEFRHALGQRAAAGWDDCEAVSYNKNNFTF